MKKFRDKCSKVKEVSEFLKMREGSERKTL